MKHPTIAFAVLATLASAAAQNVFCEDRQFNKADPATCADATNHKVFGTPGKVQYFSCDEGTTLHAFLEWTAKGKEGIASLHGIAETQEQANSLTRDFLKENYEPLLTSPHSCPAGSKELALLKNDKSGRPFLEMCGNIWSWGEGRYIVRSSKEGKTAIANFNRQKGK